MEFFASWGEAINNVIVHVSANVHHGRASQTLFSHRVSKFHSLRRRSVGLEQGRSHDATITGYVTKTLKSQY